MGLVASLRSSGILVFGLTSRSQRDTYSWHSIVVQKFFEQNNVTFDNFSDAEYGTFFASDERVESGVNKMSKQSGKANVIDHVMDQIFPRDSGVKPGLAV